MKTRIKGLIKKSLNAVDLRISRASGRRHTQEELVKHVAGLKFRPNTVIDVGVGYGTPWLYGQFPGAKYLLVEPLEEFEPYLKEVSRRYDASYVIAAAATDHGETVGMNVNTDVQSSSVFNEVSRFEGDHREVPVVSLDQLCAERNLPGPYLIKADVQGAELEVLDGASGTLAETELVLLEVSLFEFFVGGPSFYDVVHYMKKKGFVAYEIVEGHNRPTDGALAQVDIAFVKEDGRFRKHHSYT